MIYSESFRSFFREVVSKDKPKPRSKEVCVILNRKDKSTNGLTLFEKKEAIEGISTIFWYSTGTYGSSFVLPFKWKGYDAPRLNRRVCECEERCGNKISSNIIIDRIFNLNIH